jgi:hypothetical protein
MKRAMRSLNVLLAVTALAAACGDNNGVKPDASSGSGSHPDAKLADAMLDAKVFMDAAPSVDGIPEVRAAADGTVSLEVHGVTVTYVKPQVGSTTNDPAGFTVQSQHTGPALFVAVDPATLTPVPAVGDVVTFTVTTKGTTAMQPRATAIAAFTRTATGTDITPLVQDISAATDLVTALGSYDAELVSVTGTLVGAPGGSGTGFQRFELDTAGVTANPLLQLRMPATLLTTLAPIAGCGVTVTKATFSQFNTNAEVVVFNASELALTCHPSVASAVAATPTTVQVTFTRPLQAASVLADGSQFTVNNGLTVSAAAVAGNIVTLTTTAQTSGGPYTVTVANTVKDLDGNAIETTLTANFSGYLSPAVVKINELNANIANGCDIIELRVIADGAMGGFKITERTGSTAAQELSFTFPDGFNVHKNDYILVHESSASAMCNPNGATTETLMKNQQPAAMFGGNVDTAFDFWVADAGLVATNNVITLYDPTAAIVDAVFLTDVSTTTIATNTLTQAGLVGAANQWSPAQATYTSPEFLADAVTDLNLTENTTVGKSIQRLTDADTNALADWTTGAGATSTWGLNNVGQTDIP